VGIAPNFKFSPYKLVLKFDFLLAISSFVGAVPPPKIGTFKAPILEIGKNRERKISHEP
jgi:hypothetical protein